MRKFAILLLTTITISILIVTYIMWKEHREIEKIRKARDEYIERIERREKFMDSVREARGWK